MPHPTYYLLHVADPLASAAFYEQILGVAPVETAPTFSRFVLEGGVKLGLWSKATVEPATAGAPGGSEIGIAVKAPAEVDAVAAAWDKFSPTILQAPVDMDFGRSFLIADPDGHRIRVFAVTG